MAAPNRLFTTLLLALLWGAPITASADCMAGMFGVWPPSGALPPDGLILVDTYGSYEPWLEDLQPCELVLATADDRVCLAQETAFVGEFRIRQALFRPTSPLLPGRTYRLEYVPLESSKLYAAPEEKIKAIEEGTWRPTPTFDRSWRIETTDDLEPLRWRQVPRVVDLRHEIYGCGPEIQAVVALEADSEVPTLARVSVRRADEPTPRRFLLPIESTSLQIGRNMCFGAFQLALDEPHVADIELLDVTGRRTDPIRIEFTIPR